MGNKIKREIDGEIGVDGVIKYISSNSLNILGYEHSFMIGKSLQEFTHENIELDFERLGDEDKRICIPFNKIDKEVVYMDLEYDIFIERNFKKIIFSMVDVTKYISQEKKLKRILQIFEKTEDIIYSLDFKPEPNYVYLSPGIEKSLGYSLDEIGPDTSLPCEIVHPDNYEIQMQKSGGKVYNNQNFVTRYKHKLTGEYIWFEDHCMPFYNEQGELIRVDGICRNINHRKKLEEKLKYLSFHDALTGLYNRTYLEEKIKELDEYHETKVGIVVCDLDNLKYTNDKLGHYDGDQILKALGSVIMNSFDEKFVAARFGGDEFIIVLEGLEYEEMKREIANYKNKINRYNLENPKLPIKVSIGFAFTEYSKGNIRELFKKADKNMFKEKIKGKSIDQKTNIVE